jgi:glycosyltransferase involved in cell wall biosynthesis
MTSKVAALSEQTQAPMRVLQLLSSTGFHGAETMAVELVRQLKLQGVEVHLMAFDAGDGSAQEITRAVSSFGVPTMINPCAGPLDAASWRRMNAYIRAHDIELLHSHKYKTTFYALAGRLMRRYKLVTTYHNWLLDTASLRLYAQLDKTLAFINDKAVAVSTPIAQELQRYMARRKVSQVDNGIDLNRFQPTRTATDIRNELQLPVDATVLGFVGRLSPEKGLPFLLEAVSRLREQVATLQVLIIGDGPQREALAQLIAKEGLQSCCHLLGNRRDTPDLYTAMDLFVLPSTKEAYPMVLLEAMACGCAVVATEVGEVSRIVDEGITGVVVPPGDPAALHGAIYRMLADRSQLKQMAQAAQLRARAQFSSTAMARSYAQIYGEALGRTDPLTPPL